jgi:hypothetical protein
MAMVAGDAARVIPAATVTCNVICLVDTRPSPAAVTVTSEEAIFAAEDAVSARVSMVELVPDGGVIGLADQAAVTPLGSPLMLHVTLPVNEPPVAAVRLSFSVPAWDTFAVLDAALTVSVGGRVTFRAYVSVCVPELFEPVIVTVCAPAAAEDPMVRVTVAVDPGKIDAGLMLAVTPAGTFAVSATALLATPLSATVMVNVAVFPTIAAPDVVDCASAKLGPALEFEPNPQLLTSNAPSADPRPVARL